MKNIILTTGVVIVLCCFCGCRPKTLVTKGLKRNIESKNIAIDKVQFYLDREIKLRRILSSEAAKINVGKMEYLNGKYVQVIRFKKYTKGICVGNDSNQMLIAFETGEGKLIPFKINDVVDSAGIFVLNGNAPSDTIQTMQYDGKTYVLSGQATQARLLIKRKMANKLKVKVRKVKGLKVKG